MIGIFKYINLHLGVKQQSCLPEILYTFTNTLCLFFAIVQKNTSHIYSHKHTQNILMKKHIVIAFLLKLTHCTQ